MADRFMHCRPIDVNFICFWYTWDRNVLLQNLVSKNSTRTSLLSKLSFCLSNIDMIDAGYRRRTSIELLIQCHRLGLSCGRCSILTNFPSSDHAIPPVFVFKLIKPKHSIRNLFMQRLWQCNTHVIIVIYRVILIMGNDVSYTMYVGLAYVRTDDLMTHVCNGILCQLSASC